MPQQLGQTQQAAEEQRQAASRADSARKGVDQTPDEDRPVAMRRADQAERAWADAAQRTEQVSQPVQPDAAEGLAASLAPFTPETSPAKAAIDEQLSPALRQLQQGIKSEDAAAVDKAAGQARRAISAAQEELRKAQAELMDRDPLVAARMFAEAAARSLESTPADLQTAGTQQRNSASALAKAWDNSVHDAAALRLSGVPGMESLFGMPSHDTKLTGASIASGSGVGSGRKSGKGRTVRDPVTLMGIPGLREWGRLRPRVSEGRSASVRETDPPGYEQSLKVYFETLGQGQDRRNDK
jgi:hypothetical protein